MALTRQNRYESSVSVETLWSKVLYLCMKMTDVGGTHVKKKCKKESYLGNPEVEVCFP